MALEEALQLKEIDVDPTLDEDGLFSVKDPGAAHAITSSFFSEAKTLPTASKLITIMAFLMFSLIFRW